MRSVRAGARAILRRRSAAVEVEPALAAVFDPVFYREAYGDVAASGGDPLAHYVAHGRRELRQPCALFDPTWYLATNPDVAAAGEDAIGHFLRQGGTEGRDPIQTGFASRWYLDAHPEVALAGINPLVHYLTDGFRLGYDPGPHFDTSWYLETYPDVAAAGVEPLGHYLRMGMSEGRRPNGRSTTITGDPIAEATAERSVARVLRDLNADLTPLRVISSADVPRINLVTDSIGPESLFGGVATAIMLAVLWADSTGRRLRIVTRHSAPDGAGLDDLFRTLGRRPGRQPELAFIPTGPGDYLDTGEDDLFLTTSWWTTTSTLATVPADKIVYILQEDERSFYPTGSQSLGAHRAMNHPGLRVVVNTEGLRRHLIETGVENLERTSVAFEPSAAAFLRHERLIGGGPRRHLFFYARPRNPRNLFDLGLAAIDGAIERGHLPAAQWQVHLVGRHVPDLEFSDGSSPIVHDRLGWQGYRELLGHVDLGLSLMASPHPSYPPLDLAASGSVVLTNSWPGKPDLTRLGPRVLLAEPSLDALVDALGRAVDHVDRLSSEPFRPAEAPVFAPWTENLAPVVTHLVREFGDA